MNEPGDLLVSLALLAAILAPFVVAIVWYAVRPGKTRRCAVVLAERFHLAPEVSPHPRTLSFAGPADGFRMEVATAVNSFDRYPPTPMRSAIVRNLVIRLVREEGVGPPFVIDNAYGSETDFDPADFGLHPIYRIRSAQEDWLRRLLADQELVGALNGFCEPGGYRRVVVLAVNEWGAAGQLSDTTEEVAAAAADQMLRLMQIMRDRCALAG